MIHPATRVMLLRWGAQRLGPGTGRAYIWHERSAPAERLLHAIGVMPSSCALDLRLQGAGALAATYGGSKPKPGGTTSLPRGRFVP